METIGRWLTEAIGAVNDWVWSPALVGLCLVAGLYFSLRTRFVQVRRFGEMFRLLFGSAGKEKKKTGISSFQAFAMALSGRVGTGNIVGVATAIGFGGPGAIVWMWIIAFFGAGSAFVEATLAQIYKEDHNGQYRGGPAYYIEKGLRSPFFGGLFAVLAAVACGVFLPPIHGNSIALSCSQSFGLPPWVVGLLVALLLALVIIGGVKRIANVAQVVAPVMAMVYIILAIVVLAVNWQVVPAVFMQMLRGAVGVNEVGDTLLVCTATAMMILACRTYNIIDTVVQTPTGAVVSYLQQNPLAPEGEPGVFYTTRAIGTLVGPRTGNMVISVALFFFAFTTIMAYYYYAETNLVYLFNRWRRRVYKKHPEQLDELEKADAVFGDDRGERVAVWVLRICSITAVFVASLQSSGLVWMLGDIGVGIMAWINVVAILLLSPKALRSLKEYERQKKEGKEPLFDPERLNIEGAEFWETER